MTEAVPFLISALLLVLGPFQVLAIQSRLKDVFTKWIGDGEVTPGAMADAGTLAGTAVWTVDAAQILANIVAPLVGLLVLRPGLGSPLSVLYVIAFVVAVAAFLGFTFLVKVDGYGISRVPLATPVVVIGVLLNLVAAGIAAAIGP
jgi:hypothetical protein